MPERGRAKSYDRRLHMAVRNRGPFTGVDGVVPPRHEATRLFEPVCSARQAVPVFVFNDGRGPPFTVMPGSAYVQKDKRGSFAEVI